MLTQDLPRLDALLRQVVAAVPADQEAGARVRPDEEAIGPEVDPRRGAQQLREALEGIAEAGRKPLVGVAVAEHDQRNCRVVAVRCARTTRESEEGRQCAGGGNP